MLALAALAGRMLVHDRSWSWSQFLPLSLRAIAPIVVAAGFLIGSNYYFHRTPVLSRSSALFGLGHMVGEGLAQRYLARVCPIKQYLLCSEQASLRANLDWFMWDPDGTWRKHEPEVQRGDSTFLREAPAIVAGTLRQEWRAGIWTALRNTIIQLRTFGPHAGELALSKSVAKALARWPRTLQAL